MGKIDKSWRNIWKEPKNLEIGKLEKLGHVTVPKNGVEY